MEKPFREDEIALLKEIARLFRENKERILENWVAQQDAGFAWFDFLKEGIKMLIEDFVKYISRGDIERYLEGNSLIGKKIATRDVPYKAFIDAFHEFEDAYVDILKENYKENILNSLAILDRLHHSTISILAREYFTIKDATISAMAKLTESKDPETGAHIERTKEYARVIAEALGCDMDFVQKIHTTSPLHDIGKVAIPDGILLKPGPLTKEEFEVIKTHTRVGRDTIDRIIENLKIVRGELLVARDIAWYHHENYDGSGYFGLAGENIPLAARIFKIADVYDALTTKRPYKEAFSHRRAFEIITEGDGRVMPSHFDPRVLSAFKRVEKIFYRISRIYRD